MSLFPLSHDSDKVVGFGSQSGLVIVKFFSLCTLKKYMHVKFILEVQ